jgi:F420-0:gamma-glutamyl ligase
VVGILVVAVADLLAVAALVVVGKRKSQRD